MTPYQNVYERFALKVEDYLLDELFCSSVTDYEKYLLGWLKSAIPKFSKCKNDLKDRDDNEQIFNQKLTEKEEEVLAFLMQIEWSEKEVKNIQEMRLYLSNSDFKRYAESNNLKVKIDLQNQLIERADRFIVEYTYDGFTF
ncbi:hypothetical protein EBB07_29505 [Paenibacillaceae bacterium]|nr:hypothetical protein EBB07_29505 [Paenibacillaceae bacterium]